MYVLSSLYAGLVSCPPSIRSIRVGISKLLQLPALVCWTYYFTSCSSVCSSKPLTYLLFLYSLHSFERATLDTRWRASPGGYTQDSPLEIIGQETSTTLCPRKANDIGVQSFYLLKDQETNNYLTGALTIVKLSVTVRQVLLTGGQIGLTARWISLTGG